MQNGKTPENRTAEKNETKGVIRPFREVSEQGKEGAGTKNDRLKQSKNGRIKKTRRKESFFMGIAVILLLALAVMCLLLFFKVQDISVVDSAQQRYTDEELIAASGIEIGNSMLWLKEEAAAERMVTVLPYLAQAQVKKKYPTKVEITVTYARPAMAVKADAGYILLSADGKVLQTGVTVLSDYVAELQGAEVADATPGKDVVFKDAGKFMQVTTLARAFADAGYLNVTVYDVSDLQNITVEVEYKVDVKLGNIGKVEGKLAFGKEVIARSLADAKHSSSKIVVDLTTENAAYVRSQADIDAAEEARQSIAASEEETTAAEAEEGDDWFDEADEAE